MFDRRTEDLRVASALLATVVAGVHIYWGVPRFAAYASVGVMPDPRPLAFVLSGHAIVVAITLVAAGKLDARWTYLPGIALVLVHLIGYVAWHTVLAHGVSAAESATDHTHADLGGLAVDIVGHLVNSPLALVAKSTELAVVVLLAVLYLEEGRE